MATPILEVLRAAMGPAAQARTGYLEGRDFGRQRKKGEDRQAESDRREQARYEAEQGRRMDEEVYKRGRDAITDTRQAAQDKRQGLLDESRIAHEKSQAEENRERAGYYKRGGAAAARPGETRTQRRTRFIQQRGQPRLNPDTGEWEQGMDERRAAVIFDTEIEPEDRGPSGETPTGPTGATGPLAQTRAAMPGPTGPTSAGATPRPTTLPTGPTGASGPTKIPKTTIDSSTLTKKYPFLYK